MRGFALGIFLFVCLTGCGSGADSTVDLRIATFNIAMGLDEPGQLGQALAGVNDPRLQQVAEILQEVRPDIVLLNEFDFDPAVDAARLFNDNYLAHGRNPINYPYHFRAPVNTGIDSSLDLDGDGKTGGPGDAWGFGRFPGQYGMLVLSRYPLDNGHSRTFRNFRWSSLPEARRPARPDGSPFHPDPVWQELRLSSKSHWDLVFDIDGRQLHLLAHHPTPPVFDGPEDRNGLRNFDEIRFWLHYTQPEPANYLVDDDGVSGAIQPGSPFVIAGDFNADPLDGDSAANAAGQLLQASRINSDCVPVSEGAAEASRAQGGVNRGHRGDPAADTADFNDQYAGNLRLDYLLPSRGLNVRACGVFWPAEHESGAGLVEVSDHRLVWLDISL
jgi:endonuclease/exonuclease/phosphatase family metal-dependent hydrolase